MNKLEAARVLLIKPGDTILETIKSLKVSQVELAARMDITAPKVNDLISGKEPITIKTATKLEKVLGISKQFWLNSEMSYRNELSQIEQEEFLEQCIEWAKEQPHKELRKCNYIKAEKVGVEMVDDLLKFYGVANPKAWEEVYIDHHFSTSYRKSNNHTTSLAGIAAWLRIGEIEMKEMSLPEYNKPLFKKSLEKIKKLVKDHPADFDKKLKKLCADAGVALVYTPCLPKAPVSGATRWKGDNPLIQISDRYKTNDTFWFTFFHEAGHVILHGKKETFIDQFAEFKSVPEKEKEADNFACEHLLPETAIDELPEDIEPDDIVALASKYKTHPAIVVGRLQHLKIVDYYFGHNFKEKIKLF